MKITMLRLLPQEDKIDVQLWRSRKNKTKKNEIFKLTNYNKKYHKTQYPIYPILLFQSIHEWTQTCWLITHILSHI